MKKQKCTSLSHIYSLIHPFIFYNSSNSILLRPAFTMFFFNLVLVAVAAIASLAQGFEITYPKSTDTLKAGQRFRLELDYSVG